MKKQFLHEAHNRQQKAHKADYREEMAVRRGGSRSGIRASSGADGHILLEITLEFPTLNPYVVEALRRSVPNIDIARLLNALRSEASSHKSHVRRSSLSVPAGLIAREERKLASRLPKNMPGDFIRWHESLPDGDPSILATIPQEFYGWLLRFVPKEAGSVASSPNLASAPSVSSDTKPATQPKPSLVSTTGGKRVGKNIYLPPLHAPSRNYERNLAPNATVRLDGDETFHIDGLFKAGGNWRHQLTKECPRCPRVLKIVTQGPNNLPKYAADAARRLALAEHLRLEHGPKRRE